MLYKWVQPSSGEELSLLHTQCPVPLPVSNLVPPVCSGNLLSIVTSLKFHSLASAQVFSHQCSSIHTSPSLWKQNTEIKTIPKASTPLPPATPPGPCLSHASRRVCMDCLSLCPCFLFILSRLFFPPSLQVLPRWPLIVSHLLGPFGIVWHWWPTLSFLYPPKQLPWHRVSLAHVPSSP